MKYIYLPIIAALLAGCSNDDADIARSNMNRSADNFELMRRMSFYNVRLGVNVLSVEGRCSIEYNQLNTEYVCKLGDGKFIRNFVGRSNDIVAIVEQLESTPVNVYHYRRTFKPQSAIPDIDFKFEEPALHNAVTPDNKD